MRRFNPELRVRSLGMRWAFIVGVTYEFRTLRVVLGFVRVEVSW